MGKMTMEAFSNRVINEIRDWLPEEYRDAEIEIHDVRKPGGGYTGITVAPEKTDALPIINLDEFHKLYLSGQAWSSLMRCMAGIVKMRTTLPDPGWFSRYDNVKESLFLKLCNADANREILEEMPHRIAADLALTCHIRMESFKDGLYSIPLTYDMTEEFCVSEDQLFADACQYSEKMFPPRFQTMENALLEWLKPDRRKTAGHDSAAADSDPAAADSDSDNPGANRRLPISPIGSRMLLLSDELLLNGAAALFYPGIMEKAAEILKGGYYIIPSSVHELILVPEDCIEDYRRMEEIVRQINRMQVAPEEWLSDHVYHYDRAAGLFERADAYVQRTASAEYVN